MVSFRQSLLLATTATLVVQTGSPDIIPQSRRTVWQGNVGVEGGIPNRATIYTNLSASATLSQINAALAACPSNQVVLLADGKYTLNGQLVIPKSYITLRGTSTNTVLAFTGSPLYGNIWFTGADIGAMSSGRWAGSVNWTNGYTQGGSNLVFDSVTGLSVGTIITLDQIDDGVDVIANPSWEGCGYCGRYSSGNAANARSMEQWTKVTAINGKTVTVSPPVYSGMWRASQSPQAWWLSGYIQYSGIENLTIDGTDSSPYNVYAANVFMEGTWNCWVKGCVSKNAVTSHVNIYSGGRAEIRDSTFSGGQSAHSMSYGILPILTSANLIENNVFNGVTGPVVLGACSGSVISYNYSTNNYYSSPPTSMQAFLTAHDSHTYMNLIEGNHCQEIGADFYHGGSSHNTIFRNRVTGWEQGKTDNIISIRLSQGNHYWNSVGNVLGTSGTITSYAAGNAAVHYLGSANSTPGFSDDAQVAATIYRHGNYDTVNKTIVWDSSNSDHAIPSSLYLQAKPSWFGACPWPPFDSSRTGAAAIASTNIPAGYRSVFGVNPSTNSSVSTVPSVPTNLNVIP